MSLPWLPQFQRDSRHVDLAVSDELPSCLYLHLNDIVLHDVGRWVGGAGLAARLLTVSYDGSLRCLDPGAGCAFQVRLRNLCFTTLL